MTESRPVYWPFPVIPLDQQNPWHQQQIRFLETAFTNGFHPCKHYMDGEYYLVGGEGRSAWALYRGRVGNTLVSRWEIWLNGPDGRTATLWVDELDAASEAMTLWLRGGEVGESLAKAEGHIIRGPSVNQPASANVE